MSTEGVKTKVVGRIQSRGRCPFDGYTERPHAQARIVQLNSLTCLENVSDGIGEGKGETSCLSAATELHGTGEFTDLFCSMHLLYD